MQRINTRLFGLLSPKCSIFASVNSRPSTDNPYSRKIILPLPVASNPSTSDVSKKNKLLVKQQLVENAITPSHSNTSVSNVSDSTKHDLHRKIVALFDGYSKKYPRGNIPDDILISFLSFQSESGPKAVAEFAVELRRKFPIQSKRMPKSRWTGMRHSLIKIFNECLQHKESNFTDVSLLCDKLIDLGFLSNREIFLETAATFMLQNGRFNDFFFTWSSYCISEHTTAGGHVLFTYALSDTKVSKKVRQKRIHGILQVYEKVRHPADGVAQLIIAMVLTNNYDDARILWKRLSIDCIHFVKPILILAREEELTDVNAIHIRQIAQLISECVIAETKPKERVKKPPVPQESEGEDGVITEGDVAEEAVTVESDKVIEISEEQKKEELSKQQVQERGNVGFLLDHWKVYHRRRFFKAKKKKYVIKADQLEKLLDTLENTWIKIAENQPDGRKQIVDELLNFMNSQNLVLMEENQKKIDRIQAEESGILASENDQNRQCS